MKKQLLFCFILLSVVLGAKATMGNAMPTKNVLAGPIVWTGAADNNWSNPGNWLPAGVPTSSDDVQIGVTANMPTVDVLSTCNSVEITGNTTLTLAANLSISSTLTIDATATLTTGVIGFNPVSPIYFFAGVLIIDNAGGFNDSATSYVQFNNITLLTSASISNAGILTAAGANISLGFQAQIINSGAFKVAGSNISLGNSSYINNLAGGAFSIFQFGAASVINLDVQSKIGNAGAFGINNYKINMGNSSLLYNAATGSFTINGGSSIDFATNSAASASIGNDGTFYGGTSNSPCTFNLNYPGANIKNNGMFYLGSTSVINLTGDNAFVGNNAGQFTLQSDAHGSAAIGQITGNSAQCIGTYNVERYISGGSTAYRSYRLLSSPVSTTSSSGIYSLNYAAVTSPTTGTNGAAGGFTQKGNPTIYLYRDDILSTNAAFNTGNFRGVADISLAPSYTVDFDGPGFTLPEGNGFMFFYRGDKTNIASKFTPGTSAESATMTASGVLNTGQITVHQWFTPASANLDYNAINGPVLSGFALVGNPYPSSVDWDTFNTGSSSTGIYGGAGLGNMMYILDPVSHNYSVYQAGSGGVGNIITVNANVIPSGQGFFVQAIDPTAQLTFNESAKITTQASASGGNLLLSAMVTASAKPFLHLKFSMDTINVDGILINFNSNASAQFNLKEDALYRTGSGVVSLSSMSADNMALSINAQPFPKLSPSIIPLNVTASADGLYKLNMDIVKNIPQLFDIWLMDAYKKDSLDIKHNPVYSFNILKSDAASYGSKRFTLVIRQNPALGVHLLNFTAAKATGGAQVTWKTENEQDYTSFSVERSTDGGVTFNVLGGFGSSTIGAYSFLDTNPLNTNDIYRLKLTDLNGTVTYSNIVILQYGNLSNNIANSSISVYPNPASGIINLAITTPNNGLSFTTPVVQTGTPPTLVAASYGIKIINMTGAVIKSATFSSASWQDNVSTLLPGTYVIQVTNTTDNSLVGKSTFIKL